jgi:hypothetical protein
MHISHLSPEHKRAVYTFTFSCIILLCKLWWCRYATCALQKQAPNICASTSQVDNWTCQCHCGKSFETHRPENVITYQYSWFTLAERNLLQSLIGATVHRMLCLPFNLFIPVEVNQVWDLYKLAILFLHDVALVGCLWGTLMVVLCHKHPSLSFMPSFAWLQPWQVFVSHTVALNLVS